MVTRFNLLKLNCHATIFAARPSGLSNATAFFDLGDHTKWISASMQHRNTFISAARSRPLADEVIATRLATSWLPASDTSLAPLSSKGLFLRKLCGTSPNFGLSCKGIDRDL
jgi:hypothetical protein